MPPILLHHVARIVTETIYAFLARNARDAAIHLNVPPQQVVELGTQIDL